MKEFRVYVVNADNQSFDGFAVEMTDEQFMTEAETLGTVYTLEGFEIVFNIGEIQSDTDYIKIILN